MFALQLVRKRAEMGDSDIEVARQAGLDDGLMVEIVANVALNVMTNYLNKLADTDVDFPLVELQNAA